MRHLKSPGAQMNGAIPQSAHDRKRLAMCLALTAGYLDGFGLLVLGSYVSFMSGNTTMAGLRIAQANLALAVVPAIAVLFFLVGSFLGNLAVHSGLRHAQRILFVVVATLLVVVLPLQNDPMFTTVNIVALSLGMGMLNPALSQSGGESVSVTFVTGTLSRIGNHLALALTQAPVPASEGPWDTHLYRARIGAELWAAFISGAALSELILSFTSGVALIPAIALMLVLALASRAETSRALNAPLIAKSG